MWAAAGKAQPENWQFHTHRVKNSSRATFAQFRAYRMQTLEMSRVGEGHNSSFGKTNPNIQKTSSL